jgi:transcriptional regulator with XRE-family HTH domain
MTKTATGDGAKRSTESSEAPAELTGAEASDLAPVVGANLRRLRSERSLSLEALARLSGVSRAMLGQIELGHSAPTINVLWKIARALDLPFSALIATPRNQRGTKVLKASRTKRLTSHDGLFSSRALFPFDEPRRVEFYELVLRPGCVEEAEAHAPGTRENLVVSSGSVEVRVDGETHVLEAGDSILFEADTAHAYVNVTNADAVLFLVMTYAEQVG